MTSFALAHTNLALVKYWGKEDEKLRLPSAPSLSLTLDAFYTKTKLSLSKEDRFVLDGKEEKGKEAQRVFSYLSTLLSFFALPPSHFFVDSQNFVPKSAGFASSASAFCALAAAFAKEMKLTVSKRELSIASRLGSGSAARSDFGGFVLWKEGRESGESFAVPIEDKPSIPICILYLSFGAEKKKVSSTEGMRLSKSSPFFTSWRQECRKACKEAQKAIEDNSFERLWQISENNACQMHALTLSSGFSFLSPHSLRALDLAKEIREEGVGCYWSCDAGSNAALLCRKEDLSFIQKRAEKAFSGAVSCFCASAGPGVEAWSED